ncbi:alpha amylase C-terminal domain-containing protein [Phormidium tenue FACHB-886]|nr:alpha amylase C-terminal domain-containing protein [Phormidium tenue FACHB-886]
MVVGIAPLQVSTHEGMGNIVFPGGTAFRVWAPNARQVQVAFYNDSNQVNNSPSRLVGLASENNGYWSTDVAGISPDQLYRYQITNRDTGEVLYKIDPYATQITNSVGKAIVRESEFPWTDDDFRMPDHNSLVIYELHLGTFDDDPGDRPGDLARATARLDHLLELGINCVHVMPPNEFAADFSWGFNIAFPFAIESVYGGIVEFKKFVDRAHSLGIAVITDSVFNHFGPGDLDECLRRFDGWHQGEHGGIYFYNDDREPTDWGPRPDFGRPEVRQFIRDNVMFLLGECHCDGLRIDSTCNVWGFNNGQGWNDEGFNLLRWISDEKNFFHRYPRHKIFIAEDWHNDGWVTRPTPVMGAGFDAEWHWFVHEARHALENPSDQFRDMNGIARALYARFNNDAFKRVIYTESHDESGNNDALARRIDSANPESWFAKKRTTLGAALVLTAPGIPMIWQGQELFSIDKFSDTIPLDWSRKETFNGIFQLYQRLCQLRRNWDNNTRGLRGQHINCHVVDNLNKVVAFHRWNEGGPGDDVIVILNFSDRTWDSYRVGLPSWGTWWCRFSSDWAGYSNDFGNVGGHPVSAEAAPKDNMPHSAGFAIGPYSALIYSQ